MIAKNIREWVMARIQSAAARWHTLAHQEAGTSRRAHVAGRAGDEEEESYEDEVKLYQSYGFRSFLPTGSDVITVATMGASSQRAIVASELVGVGPDDLTEGEVGLYSNFGQLVKLDDSGRVVITVESGGQITMRDDGAVVIVDGSGGSATLADGRLTVINDVARSHDLGTGNTPLCVQLDVSVVISAARGTDRLFEVDFNVINNPVVANAPVFSATFARAYASAPLAQLTQRAGTKRGFNWATTSGGVQVSAAETLNVGESYTVVISTGGSA